MSPGQKFSYSRDCLKGDALKAIAGLRVVDRNYEDAKAILKNRFGDPTVIKRSLYAQLKAIPKSNGSTPELRKKFIETDKLVRQLKTLEGNVNQAMILLKIEEKFPVYFLIEVKKRGDLHKEWTIPELLKEIEFQITIRERAEEVI